MNTDNTSAVTSSTELISGEDNNNNNDGRSSPIEKDKTDDDAASRRRLPTAEDVDTVVVCNVTESVLVVPLKLCKTAQNVLFRHQASPLGHHLEGRYGSRTHRIDKTHMGIPIMDKDYVLDLASHDDHHELKDLLQQPDVTIQQRPYSIPPPHRALEIEEFDACTHPENATPEERLDCENLWRHLVETVSSSTDPSTSSLSSKQSLPTFTYAELFAGTGAFGIALRELGGRCVFVSELEQHLRDVFCHNFPEVVVAEEGNNNNAVWGDITQVPDDAFPKTLDLLVGGFPCQPFSSMGEQPGFDCQKSGNLFLDIARCLRVSQPKAFLLENVPGLLTMTETYDTIIRTLEEVGYTVTSEAISSRGLTATKRKRLYIIGFRRDVYDRPKTTTSEAENDGASKPFVFPFIPDLSLRARDVLDYDDLPQSELDIIRMSGDTLHQFLTSRRFKRKNLAWPNTVCSTIISHYGNAVGRGESQMVPCAAPHAPRRFSIRECARLMGFPNWYKFLPPRENQSPMAYRKEYYRMIGNAVCPPVIAALAGAVLDRIMPVGVSSSMEIDCVQRGRQVAMELAAASLRPQKRAPLPIGCLVPNEYAEYGYTSDKTVPVAGQVEDGGNGGGGGGEGQSHFPCKRKVSFGNPALGTYGGYVYTLPSLASQTVVRKRPPLVEGAEAVDRMCAFIDVPPEHVPEGILDLIRSHRPFIETVRVVIAEPKKRSENNDMVNEDKNKKDVGRGDMDHIRDTSEEDGGESSSTAASRTYLVLFQLTSQDAVDSFVEDLNGRPYIPFDDTELCTVQPVVAMEGENGVSLRSGPNFAALPPPSATLGDGTNSAVDRDALATMQKTVLQMTNTHDQNCAVCLEHLTLPDSTEQDHGSAAKAPSEESDKKAILTTVCNHTFHLDCLVQCSGPCPVCRYDHSGLNETLSQCHLCGTTENNFVCLICGVVSCVGSIGVSNSAAASAAPSVQKVSLSASIGHNQDDVYSLGGTGVAGHDHSHGTMFRSNGSDRPPEVSAIAAHRFHHSHAAQHYNDTLHAYALDTQTQHVWDFAGQGYVHRLIQNKEDGKLVEMNDPFNSSSNERTLTPGLTDTQEGEVLHRKLENYASQYYTLLKSQLEQQRTFYEGRLQEIRREFATKKRDEEKAKMDLVSALKQEKKQLSHRLQLLQTRRDKVLDDSKFLQNMNESLEVNLPALKARIKDAQRERIESRTMFQQTLPPLEEKLAALMLQLEESTTG
jgi:DNA-cytosine methyltransferase